METKSKDMEKYGTNFHSEEGCPGCGGNSLVRDYKHNTLVCGDCGRVVEEDIKDQGPEWRAYNQKERNERRRGGPPISETIHDRGLSTQIDWKDSDSRGKDLSPERKSQMYRLRKWQKRSKISGQKDRNLTIAFSEITRIASQLGLPKSIQDVASRIYRQAVEEDLIRGRSIEMIVSAVIYIACRKSQIPRTLDEVAEFSSYDRRDISRSYRSLMQELDIHLDPVDPVNFVARFGGDLDVSGETQSKAIDIMKRAKERNLTAGKSPKGTAAAALYIASIMNREKKSQRQIAEATGITEVTLRNRYKEIVDKLDIDLEV